MRNKIALLIEEGQLNLMMKKFKTPMAGISLLLLAMAIVSLLVGLPYVMAGDSMLFIDQPDQVILQGEGVSQAKWVTINWPALDNPRVKEITIPLFDGETITAEHERTDPSTAAGGYVWVGHVPGDPNSSVMLSVVDEVLIGSITLGGIEQTTIGYKNGRQLVQALDPNGRIEVEGPDTITAPVDSSQTPQEPTFCEDGSRVDLLVAYTPAARVQEGGSAAIEALINQRVAGMNSANKNSGLSFTFELVHVMETSYPETGDVRTDLQRLSYDGDGHLDDVVQARDLHQADMVSLIIAQSKVNNSCGIAYAMQSLSTAYASSAFNVAALDYAGPPTCNPLTMAHEFGHNMGNHHDRANAGSYTVFPYSYGYQSPNSTFRTIMAYQCANAICPRINHWSNPEITYLGEATGVDYEVSPGSAADNARSMAQTALYVANFRQNCSPTPTPTHTPTPTQEPAASPSSTATYTTSTPVSSTPDATRVTLTPTPQLTHHFALPFILALDP